MLARVVVPAVLIVVALIHVLPLAGVLGTGKLADLYGIPVQDPNLEILLRHRAVLFGLVAGLLGWSAFHPHLHGIALVALILLAIAATAYLFAPSHA